ncbi:hypothetical protein [Sulfitobacter dubius]|uniref:MAE-28990/MAE-18760-like HEPN domain-containing protein n=1 Tax=Sulfitobacter dubius TaxID=218673 RepID=A0ABY3ZJX6_9RHOB|nr:hypothetical protein [Sulfitobacter dubius]UOA14990.1 hypothetical protein DSM109990_01809 [Sulfitobacter dubius]
MAAPKVDYSKIDDVSEVADRLFKVMMRLEFALKDVGFFASGRRAVAEVDWVRFANDQLGADFWQSIKAAEEVQILIHAPPKRQIVDKNGNLFWQSRDKVGSVQELVAALNGVRNNLFHGGKSGDPDGDRNADLIRAALYLVDQILKEDDVLHTSFSETY